MKLYDEVKREVTSRGDKVIPGDVVYRLYDTFGFPVDITNEMAQEDGLFLDTAGFEKALGEQKERSRTDRRSKEVGFGSESKGIVAEDLKNRFTGYETLESDATILALIKDGEPVEELNEGDEGALFFDATPFYGEAGGQVSDDGIVQKAGSTALVMERLRVKENLFAHDVKVEKGSFSIGDAVHLAVDREKRRAIARNHTATHLLQFALRSVLGEHVKQSGSLVEQDRLRFDFTHFEGLDTEQLARVEDIVNEKILDTVEVDTEIKDREAAIREGATALFEEKYGESVRVVSIDGFSRELCGGTHVKNTGEIGSFTILSESSLASGIRRIEAVTGKGAVQHRRKMDGMARSIAKEPQDRSRQPRGTCWNNPGRLLGEGKRDSSAQGRR